MPLVIGAGNTEGTTNQFNGLIDEFLIYKRNLTIDEVLKLYNLGNGISL